MGKVLTKQDFSIDWLVANKFYVDLPKDPVSRIIILGFLYRGIKEGNPITVVQHITKGVSPSQLYQYRRNNWTVCGSKLNKLKLVENTVLTLAIRDCRTDRPTGYRLSVLLREIMQQSEPRTISVEKAIDIREALTREEESKQRTFTSITEIEEVALNICQMFASGRLTIYEVCARHQVSYLDFFKWVIGMESVRLMYEDAVKVSKFVSESQIYTVAINMVLEKLKAGYTSATDIVYDAIWVNGIKRFVEKAKRTTTRDINISELIRVLMVLKSETGVPAMENDDFAGMSDQELFDYIKDIRGRTPVKKLPIPEEEKQEDEHQ